MTVECTCTTKGVPEPPFAGLPVVHWMGVDVSKATFDAALWVPGTQGGRGWSRLPAKQFARTKEGAKGCYTWAWVHII